MRKAHGIVAVVLIVAFWALAAGAQSAQPPMSNQSMSNHQAQGQAPGETAAAGDPGEAHERRSTMP